MKTKPKKLTAKWSKRENDILYFYPDQPANGSLLHSYLSGYGVTDDKGNAMKIWDELERRGYDKTTLRFSIKKKADE